MKTCVLCGRRLPSPQGWFARLLFIINPPPPTCYSDRSLSLEECWAGYRRRVGLPDSTPMPDPRR